MQVKITLERGDTCWLATFEGGHMPQRQPLPLPWSQHASVLDVVKDMRTRFAGALIFYRDLNGNRHHAA